MPNDLVHDIDGSGPPLLLIHGLGATSNVWGPQLPALARLFTVIRPDLRGSGRSTSAGEVSVDGHVNDLIALLDNLGHASVHVAGWSYGASVAARLAVEHPGRVQGLALLGPLPAIPAQARDALRHRAAAVRDGGLRAVADATATGGTAAATQNARPELAAFVRELVAGQNPEGYAKTCEAIADGPDPRPGEIKSQTLVLAGDEDTTAPPRAVHATAAPIPNLTLHTYSRCGH